MGWDNLQTELYPWLAVKRAWFSTWQEYQSFGHMAGLAHGADIVRAIGMFFVSFLLPQYTQRYVFHMGMLLFGVWGMYKLLCFLLQKSGLSRSSIVSPALLGALFYLLNVATMQMFALPFEAFSIFFAALPWQVWIFFHAIVPSDNHEEKKTWKGKILLLFLINILSTPQAYIQTLFVVYMLVLVLLTLGLLLVYREHFVSFAGRALGVGMVILAINAFWLLPQVYFFQSSSSVVQDAKINTMSTDDMYYLNREKGTWKDFFFFRGFYSDTRDYTGTPLFAEWQDHFAHPFFLGIAVLCTMVWLYGLFLPGRMHIPFILLLFLVATALISAELPFSFFNEQIRSLALLDQIFRTPFTKFATVYTLVASYFFAWGVECLGTQMGNVFRSYKQFSQRVPQFLFWGIFGILIAYAWPAFRGDVFAPTMQRALPSSYHDAMEYFRTQDTNTRIALLPDDTFWGWYRHEWGYNGSGFLWYGIEQPIVSRTFDVWNYAGESAYWEMVYALQQKDTALFETVLEKYAIDFILLDESVRSLSSRTEASPLPLLREVLAKSDFLQKEQIWGDLTLYRISSPLPRKQFVSLFADMPNGGPAVRRMEYDPLYTTYGTYMSSALLPFEIYSPFLGVFTQVRSRVTHWQIDQTDDSMRIMVPYYEDSKRFLPPVSSSPPVMVYQQNMLREVDVSPSVSIDTDTIVGSFPRVIVHQFDGQDAHLSSCQSANLQNQKIPIEEDGSLLLSARGGNAACVSFASSFLDQQYSYLVQVDTEHVEGRLPHFYIIDQTTDQRIVEDYLSSPRQYYILPPRKNAYGFDYTFTLRALSHSNLDTTYRIRGITVYAFPHEQLQQYIISTSGEEKKNALFFENFVVQHPSYDRYRVSVREGGAGKTLVVAQQYHTGWKAFVQKQKPSGWDSFFPRVAPFWTGDQMNHVRINNWANGWILPDNALQSAEQDIIILFLPQYYQYLGFGLLIVVGVLILLM